MRKVLTAALAAAILAGGVLPATSAFAGFGGPGNFANPQPGGGGGGGGAWPMPTGPKWGFGVTITHSPQPGAHVWEAHAEWCDDRWKTYAPDTDMYMSTDGPRLCISPMSPYLD